MGPRTQRVERQRYLIVNVIGSGLREALAPKALLGAALLSVGPEESPELLADWQHQQVVALQKAAQKVSAATSASKLPFLSSSQNPSLKMKADTAHAAADLPCRSPSCDSIVHWPAENHAAASPRSGSVLRTFLELADFEYFDFQNSIWPTPSSARPHPRQYLRWHLASSTTAPSRCHLPVQDMSWPDSLSLILHLGNPKTFIWFCLIFKIWILLFNWFLILNCEKLIKFS